MQDLPVAPSLAAWQGGQQAAIGGCGDGGQGGAEGWRGPEAGVPLRVGDYVAVLVEGYRGGTLLARPLARTSIAEYAAVFGGALEEAGAAGLGVSNH
jgi:hypothetical protein